jgi:lipopolysaccharide export LptBFGC system permease protein LptF
MKKLLIGAIVGGILVFAWQTLSWTVLDLHGKEYRQAKNQDSIMSYLNSQFSEDGQYMIPREAESASSKEMEEFQKNMMGKPWAVVSYHKSYNTDMMMNIIRGLLVSIVSALFVCWVLMKQSPSSFGTTFISSVLIGLAGYLFIPYSNQIWFQTPGGMTNMIDALVSWGLCGIWLGWWLNRK